LFNTHLFCAIATKTAGRRHNMAIELTQEIGRRINMLTENTKETIVVQRLFVALPKRNAVSFRYSLVSNSVQEITDKKTMSVCLLSFCLFVA